MPKFYIPRYLVEVRNETQLYYTVICRFHAFKLAIDYADFMMGDPVIPSIIIETRILDQDNQVYVYYRGSSSTPALLLEKPS